MLITIENNLVETKYIWNITEVKKAGESAGVFKFDICFLNDKTITVIKSIKNEKYNPKYKSMSYEKLAEMVQSKLGILRKNIVECWKQDQNDIPSFNY